ncbi:hypothetical protein ZIOFF_073971 [Zingiber officinale]|uniref:Cation efflux protein transmembrane domain-containing protein n=1 Tax=Zingiber officinale TaxID=94328 RepID=A0A8J5C858_ZINOF|nr:hypothetical protein ZIOFF_073971 [Zingiber officinale]
MVNGRNALESQLSSWLRLPLIFLICLLFCSSEISAFFWRQRESAREREMEGEVGEAREPLAAAQPLLRRYSVNSLRTEFVARLPAKLRDQIDPESIADVDLSRVKGLRRGEREYYERQFATLRSFEEVDSLGSAFGTVDFQDDLDAKNEFAMKISNFANIVLLVFKIYATVRTGSMAIAASTLDSLLDFMAGGILWFAHLSMKNVNIYKYPIGKLRVQPVGIIVFAAIMATLGMPHLCLVYL